MDGHETVFHELGFCSLDKRARFFPHHFEDMLNLRALGDGVGGIEHFSPYFKIQVCYLQSQLDLDIMRSKLVGYSHSFIVLKEDNGKITSRDSHWERLVAIIICAMKHYFKYLYLNIRYQYSISEIISLKIEHIAIGKMESEG